MLFGTTNKETNKQAKKGAKKSPFYWCKEESVRYRGGDYNKTAAGRSAAVQGRLFRFLASENEVHDQRDVCGYADEGGAVACSPSA